MGGRHVSPERAVPEGPRWNRDHMRHMGGRHVSPERAVPEGPRWNRDHMPPRSPCLGGAATRGLVVLRAQATVRGGLRSGGDLCEGKAEELAEGKLGGQGRE